MLHAAEIALLVFLFYKIRQFIKRQGARNLVALVSFLLAVSGSVSISFLGLLAVSQLSRNFAWHFTVMALLALFSYCLIRWALLRHTPSSFQITEDWLAARLENRRWLDRSITGATVIVFTFWTLTVAILFSNLASREPKYFGPRVQTQSLFAHLLLIESEASKGTHLEVVSSQRESESTKDLASEEASLDQAIAKQKYFLKSLSTKFTESKELLAEKTGTAAVMDYLDAIKEIVDLPWQAQLWLKHTDPHLLALFSHPQLIAVTENERVVALIEEASQGSLTAVYRLGDEPDIIAFIEDDALVAHIRGIDMLELQRLIRTRLSSGLPYPALWYLAQSEKPLEASARNQIPADQWTESEFGDETMQWPETKPYHVAKTSIDASNVPAIRVRIQADAAVRLWAQGNEFALNAEADWFVAEINNPGWQEPLDLIVVFEARQASVPSAKQGVFDLNDWLSREPPEFQATVELTSLSEEIPTTD